MAVLDSCRVRDDVVLRNDSPYPLTNVRFAVTLRKGGKTTNLDLKCDLIKPGETQKWTDVVGGVEGKWDDSSKAELSCDQSPE